MLFGLSYDYVGDLSETVALMWPTPASQRERRRTVMRPPPPRSPRSSPRSRRSARRELPAQLAHWLDALDETGRWALLKLVTGALRIGVSARLAKTAVAALGDKDPDEIELIWPGLEPPYLDLFAWLEGRGAKPETGDPAPFRPVMLAHAIEEPELAALDPADFIGRMEMGRHPRAGGGGHARRRHAASRGSIRAPARTFPAAFPISPTRCGFAGAIDGELLVVRDGRVQSFNVLQQRLNRKTVSAKLLGGISGAPARLRPPGRRRRGFARACRSPSAARGSKRWSPGSTIRASTCRR